MVKQFAVLVRALQARLHAFPALWRCCSSLQNAVCRGEAEVLWGIAPHLRNSLSLQGQTPTLQGRGRHA